MLYYLVNNLFFRNHFFIVRKSASQSLVSPWWKFLLICRRREYMTFIPLYLVSWFILFRSLAFASSLPFLPVLQTLGLPLFLEPGLTWQIHEISLVISSSRFSVGSPSLLIRRSVTSRSSNENSTSLLISIGHSHWTRSLNSSLPPA